jgi:hypothetical protein
MWGDRNSLAQCSYEGSGASYVYQAITFVDTLRIGVILFYEPPALLSGAHLKSIEAMCDTLRPDFQALVERIQFAHIRQGAGTAAQQRVAPDDPR